MSNSDQSVGKVIFTFGETGAGKSTLMASLSYYIAKHPNIIPRLNLDSSKVEGTKLLLTEWLSYLKLGKFPDRTPPDRILPVDFGAQTFDGNNIELGMTFLEVSGEQFANMDLRNVDKINMNDNIEKYLRNSSLIFIVVPSDKVASNDVFCLQFFEFLDNLNLNHPVALIISKWDLVDNHESINVISFVEENFEFSQKWMKSGKFNLNIFKFSVGEVIKKDGKEPEISKFNPIGIEEISTWLFNVLLS